MKRNLKNQEEFSMVRKLKNKVQVLLEKWKSIPIIIRFVDIAMLISIIVIFALPINTSAFLKEENYIAMEQVVSEIVEQKNTDIEFDTSKIISYEVFHNADASKDIYIYGKTLEEIRLTVDKDYQIKKLAKGGIFTFILVCITYMIISWIIGYTITKIMFFINRTIRKIIKFFKT